MAALKERSYSPVEKDGSRIVAQLRVEGDEYMNSTTAASSRSSSRSVAECADHHHHHHHQRRREKLAISASHVIPSSSKTSLSPMRRSSQTNLSRADQSSSDDTINAVQSENNIVYDESSKPHAAVTETLLPSPGQHQFIVVTRKSVTAEDAVQPPRSSDDCMMNLHSVSGDDVDDDASGGRRHSGTVVENAQSREACNNDTEKKAVRCMTRNVGNIITNPLIRSASERVIVIESRSNLYADAAVAGRWC